MKAADPDPLSDLDRLYIEFGKDVTKGTLSRRKLETYRDLAEQYKRDDEDPNVKARANALIEFCHELEEFHRKKITWTLIQKSLLTAFLIYFGFKVIAWLFFPKLAAFF